MKGPANQFHGFKIIYSEHILCFFFFFLILQTPHFTFTVFYLKKTAGLLLLENVCHSKICISLHMKMFETHLSKLTQLQTQTHLHFHYYAWIAAAICFPLKLIVVDIQKTLLHCI